MARAVVGIDIDIDPALIKAMCARIERVGPGQRIEARLFGEILRVLRPGHLRATKPQR
jgi:hypothetical protein